MPELPEVENVRLGLLKTVLGRAVRKVSLRRADVVTGKKRPGDLLSGRKIADIGRLGKQLVLLSDEKGHGPCVCVHLGMTGSLRYYDSAEDLEPDAHTHVTWHLSDSGYLVFRDPRRFGGLWTFGSKQELVEQRWMCLGPDALVIKPRQLLSSLRSTQRAIKAVLLDQSVVAGLGNIYVDELLFLCRIRPQQRASELNEDQARRLVHQMRCLLKRAIRSGGSTLRDYVSVKGQAGAFQISHKVYGRSGQPCVRCGTELSSDTLAGRSTVYCHACQTT